MDSYGLEKLLTRLHRRGELSHLLLLDITRMFHLLVAKPQAGMEGEERDVPAFRDSNAPSEYRSPFEEYDENDDLYGLDDELEGDGEEMNEMDEMGEMDQMGPTEDVEGMGEMGPMGPMGPMGEDMPEDMYDDMPEDFDEQLIDRNEFGDNKDEDEGLDPEEIESREIQAMEEAMFVFFP